MHGFRGGAIAHSSMKKQERGFELQVSQGLRRSGAGSYVQGRSELGFRAAGLESGFVLSHRHSRISSRS